MTDLGTLGGENASAAAINSMGKITGAAQDSTGASFACLWTGPGQVSAMAGAPPGSRGRFLNDNDEVGGSHAALRAFHWSAGAGFRDLGTLQGGDYTSISAMNKNGVLVASSGSSGLGGGGLGGGIGGGGIPTSRAFRWTLADGLRGLGDLGGGYAAAYAVNAGGDIVGTSGTPSGALHAALWPASGGIVDLGTLGGTSAVARAINDSGQVAGESTTASGESRAFIWPWPGTGATCRVARAILS